MDNGFSALIKVIIDKAQARSEVENTIKTLQKSAQLETDIKIKTSDVKSAQKEINNLTNSVEKLATASEKISAQSRFQNYLSKNTAISKEAKASLNSWISELQSGSDISKNKLNEMTNSFKLLDAKQRQANKLGLSFTDGLKEQAKTFTQWIGVSGAVMTAVQTMREMYQAVYDVDTAMTSLYKVTNATNEEYQNFLSNANTQAQELGRSVSSLIQQTANWAQLGYNLPDATELAKVSSIYSNVGDVDDDTAVGDLVSIMHAFNIEASDSISIVDKLNEVSNNYSVSASDLGTGLKNSASALNLAGNSIDQTIAMITAMNSVVQDASESGNALKVLSMRLRGATTDLEGIGEETDGVIKSTSTLRDTIKTLTNGFDIMKDDGSFKSTYDIMKGIASVWQQISDVDQANLLQIIAGKQRGNAISALLTQMSQANNVLTTSINSQGSAYAEQAKWMQSLEAEFCLVA